MGDTDYDSDSDVDAGSDADADFDSEAEADRRAGSDTRDTAPATGHGTGTGTDPAGRDDPGRSGDSRDPDAVEREIVAFIEAVVDDAGADGVVANLSGGIDSTVAATLAVEALGPDQVSGLVLPADANEPENVADARAIADSLGIAAREIELQPLLDAFTRTVAADVRTTTVDPLSARTRTVITDRGPNRERYGEAMGNVAARLRMTIAYFEANTTGRLVLGTGNRTELLLGYFTKYGDGGVDCLPIGDLYKTEVRSLARHLDVPEAIVDKPPTAGLWEGQTDEDELGAPYETIDAILRSLVDEGLSVGETADELGADRELVAEFDRMHADAAHKRATPPTPATR